MTLALEKYVRKPFYVEAVQVTEENISEVAAWCGGNIFSDNLESPDGRLAKYVQVRVRKPLNERQTKAYVNDWILFAGGGYKVYTPKAFLGCFEAVTGTTKDAMDQAEKPQPTLFETE